MTTFTIDSDNNITAHATADEGTSLSGAERFTSAAELAELAANWPADRLVVGIGKFGDQHRDSQIGVVVDLDRSFV